ncbi:MAG: carbohydrate ABC transporter substrate-binding protein [Mycolicibacterium sp.]|nr:carbohydrate ABC transporter substrate-binding protein [Mycolicibacterium sp.]
MKVFEASGPLWPASRRLLRGMFASLALVAMAVASGACTGSTTNTSQTGTVGGSLTVWVDAVRLPAAKAYQAAHPNVNVNIVTFDGDGNGATGLQGKINLWNQTGKGWPDVIFSEQVNDPIWMAQAPFNFAENLTSIMPQSILSQWPAPSTAQCTYKGAVVCLQDNLAQDVLWVNTKLMSQFGYTTPTTWQEWQAIGEKVSTEHPGYIIGTIGESFSHWIYFWANQCPLQQFKSNGNLLINVQDVHCTEMASLLDPLIADGALPPVSIFSADTAKTYGGAADKFLMLPGPAWYSSQFAATLKLPAGEWTAAPPLSWNGESPVTTGQVGGGPWIISRHSSNLVTAADFVTWVTTVFNPPSSSPDYRPGYPAYPPLATAWLASMKTNSYWSSDPTPALTAATSQIWTGWNLVTYPDQPVWSNTVITGLIAKKSLSSLMPAFGQTLTQTAMAAGYTVVSS